MTPPAKEPITRTPLQKSEYPDGHFTYVMMVEIVPNGTAARHTHPGLETAYILEGELELTIEGRPPQKLKAGDSFSVPPNAVHSIRPASDNASIHCFCFAVGVKGAGDIDYTAN